MAEQSHLSPCNAGGRGAAGENLEAASRFFVYAYPACCVSQERGALMGVEKTRLLIVDDEQDGSEALKHYLSSRGYEVSIALSGEEAMRILKSTPVEIVILDIIMQDVNGDVIAKMIRNKYPHIKILLITGYPDIADLVTRLVAVEGCFNKPFGIEEIYQKLQELAPH
jgi:DNA-binding NtrC family response regulator